MSSYLVRLWNSDEGATAVEYALMVAAITAVIVAVVFTLGLHVSAAFSDMDSKLGAYLP